MLEFLLPVIMIMAVNVWFIIGYIGKNGNFPKPLTKEEETEYLNRMYSGDTEARNILIERNLRLVAHIAKKYSYSSADAEELISIGTIGLIKGVSSYNNDKGTRLATYVARCIENEILMSLRSNKKHQNDISINDIIGMDGEGNEITLSDILEDASVDVPEKVSVKIQTEEMYNIISTKLTKREAEIIKLRFGLFNTKAKTQQEIAEIYGISRSYVSRIEKRAVEKIRKAMNEK